MTPLLPRIPEPERTLLERAARWRPEVAWTDLRGDQLRQLAAREGLDFATALLYDRLRRSPEHGPVIARLESMPPPRPGDFDASGVSVVVVPGAFYVEYPHTGADGRLILEEATRFGCRAVRVPTRSFGTTAENGRILCDWLYHDRGEGPVVLVSLSKGGTDVAQALAAPDAGRTFRRVVAWVSLSGIIAGTPLVDWLLARRLRTLLVRLLFWVRGLPFATIRELGRGRRPALAGPLPEGLWLLHVSGFPLACHASNRLARRGLRRLAPLGPNDGGALLADLLTLPGIIYPVWGADHYLRPAGDDMRGLFPRILGYLSAEGILRSALPAGKEWR